MRIVTYLCLPLFLACTAFAQVTPDWEQVCSGGELSSNGTYTTQGTIGLPCTGFASDGVHTMLAGGSLGGIVVALGVDESNPVVPREFALNQNYPNPFNPTTQISFRIAVPTNVSLQVYNVLGQEVKNLFDGNLPSGNYSLVWDGTDSEGKPAATGVYLYRLVAGEFSEVRKMLLLK